eukprot:3701761-Pleurochrysis_carterae.AAC.2
MNSGGLVTHDKKADRWMGTFFSSSSSSARFEHVGACACKRCDEPTCAPSICRVRRTTAFKLKAAQGHRESFSHANMRKQSFALHPNWVGTTARPRKARVFALSLCACFQMGAQQRADILDGDIRLRETRQVRMQLDEMGLDAA